METVDVNLDEVLSDCDCHFTWALETFSDPQLQVKDYIWKYNEATTRINKFENSLFLSYIMYRDGLCGWDKLLENTLRLMENTRDPNYPQGLEKLPSVGSPVYDSSTIDFFAYTEDVNAASTDEKDVHDSVSEENGLGERLKNDEDSFTGLYVAAEHVFYSLKATIMLRIGASSTEVLEVLTHVVHKDDMTSSDRAALLFLKATAIRECGDKGLDTALEILKAAILSDPDNFRWLIALVHYSGQKRRLMWGRGADRSEIEPLIEVIDSVLQHDLEPGMRVKYQFEKLQALKEMLYKSQMSTQEMKMIGQSIHELKETLVRTTDEPKILAYCAQLYLKNFREIPTAILLVEKALESRPDCTYVNAKASNVYKRGGYLDKALECAEKAAKVVGFGSCWQVFELKRALQHTFDYEEFFCNVIKNYPQDEHVKVTHRNASLFYMVQGDYYPALVHFKDLLDKYDSDDEVYDEAYCGLIFKRVCAVEAAYNVVALVLGSSCEPEDSERRSLEKLCNAVKEEIEDKFDLDDFKHTGLFTSEQYIEWLREKQPRGSGPLTTRHAEDKHLSPFQFSGYHSNNYTNSGSSDYQHQFRNNFAAAGPSQNNVGNQSVPSINSRTPFQNYPRRQSQDRLSGYGGRGFSSCAQNMANYFGRLGSSTDKTRNDYKNTRTTGPQLAGTYSQQNYKPHLQENWRDRDNGNTVHESPKESSGSSQNWRDRDNLK